MKRLSLEEIQSIFEKADKLHTGEKVTARLFIARMIEQKFIEHNPQFDRRAQERGEKNAG